MLVLFGCLVVCGVVFFLSSAFGLWCLCFLLSCCVLCDCFCLVVIVFLVFVVTYFS